MITDVLKDLILQKLGTLKPASKKWFKRNCMLCSTQGHGADRRQRFGIKFEQNEITCNCFNCGFSAHWEENKSLNKNFKFFLKNIGVDDKLIKELEFEIYKQQNQIEVVRDGEVKEDKEAKFRSLFSKWKPTELPDGALPLTVWLENNCDDKDFLKVVNYALDRKIFSLDEFYWTPTTANFLNKRLITPYYYKNKIVGYTARYFENLKDKSIPKYYQLCPEDFVYNLDPQDNWQRKYVIVTEGVLDAWTVDGVSILGEINQEKVDVINRLQKTVIVCPDRDHKGYDLVEVAIRNDWMVAFPKWDIEIKDAAAAAEKYGRLLTTHSIIASAIKGKEKIILNWKIAQNERDKRLQH